MTDPTLTGVTLDPPGPVSMYAGDYLNLAATAHYDDGTTEPLGPVGGGTHAPWFPSTFTTSDDTVATVSSGTAFFGRAYSVAPGSATVTVQMAFSPTDELHSATVDITVTDGPAHVVPAGRFNLAFGHPTLQPYPDWTAIDTHPNLVTSYSIDRGRSYELDQTGGGTATVQIIDPDGILDPTNPAGPYYGQIRPMLQALLCRHNPVTGTWEERYRGFVDDYSYELDATQRVNRLTVSLVDLFDIVGSAQMQPGQFGDAVSDGQIQYSAGDLPGPRIVQILNDTGIPTRMQVAFRGNVHLQTGTYSSGESPLTAIQETVDAEFPGVGNLFCDRHGRISFHGRHARFNPPGIAALEPEWDYHHWKAGDGVAVDASPSDTAQARTMSFQRGVSKIINSAVATEQGAPDDTTSRQVTDIASVGTYGMRSWSSTNLLTNSGDIGEAYATTGATETKRFAQFYVANYAQPRDRISQLTFKSLHPSDPRAGANWRLLSQIDISDTIDVTVATAGGGGFVSEGYFVEGIHEQTSPLTPGYDDVTVTVDLSPRSYYGVDPWDTPLAAPDDPPTPGNRNPRRKKTSSNKPGPQVPAYHAADHGYTGPDPFGMHYDNVGAPAGTGASSTAAYSISGTLSVSVGQLRWTALADGTLTLAVASVGTPPAGAALTVAVNLNGASVGTITIPDGSNVGTAALGAAFATGDYFTVDVTAASGAADLVVELMLA
jgi:hypothetical protein